MRFTTPYPVRVPYRLDFLPADLTPFNIVQDAKELWSTVQLESTDQTRVMDITVGDRELTDNPDWDWQPATIAGHPAQCADLVDGRRCTVDLDGVAVGFGSGSLEMDELERLVAGMTLATWSDPATWYDIDTALPSR